MTGPSHRVISHRDWKHELGRCSACGAGVRVDKASQRARTPGAGEAIVVYECPRCRATTHFHITDGSAP